MKTITYIFVSHLDTVRLKYLRLHINSAPEPVLQDSAAQERFDDLEMSPLLAVKSISLHLPTSIVHHYWKFLPNVEKMDINIDHASSSARHQTASCGSGLTESIKTFSNGLARNGPKFELLFPKLRLLTASFGWGNYGFPSEPLASDMKLSLVGEDEIRSTIAQFLEERERLGALPLVLRGPVRFFYETGTPDQFDFQGVRVVFEACVEGTEVGE
jgi:hypothetical protein